jgi:short-subunit dehydrogenase
MKPLRDKVVLITGASRGLGVDMARAFAKEGSKLALAARSGSELEVADQGVEVSVVCPGFVDGGMFLRWGRPAPKVTGAVSPQRVADAVIKAVRDNKGEIIVTKGLGKIADVTFAAMPEIAAKVMKRTGASGFLEEQARINAEKR